MGPEDDLTVAIWAGSGKDVTLSIVYIDPANVIAASYDVTVKSDQHVLTHSPSFHKPLRPGNWESYLFKKTMKSANIPYVNFTKNV